MIVYFRTFLLFFALVVLPAHGGKRGLKVYPKKDENSEDYLMLQNWRKLLRDLMLMYTISIEEMQTLKKDKLREMSEKLAHKVWQRPGYKRDSYFNNDFIVRERVNNISVCS